MKPLGQFDKDYSDRMMAACMKAIIETAHDKDTNVALLRNSEIYRALLTIMATFLATSKEATTPRGVRLLCDEFRKDLSRRIVSYRDEMKAKGTPFSVSEFDGYQ